VKKALLVIDLQNDYFPGGKFPLWNTEVVLQNIEQAIAKAGFHAFSLMVVRTGNAEVAPPINGVSMA